MPSKPPLLTLPILEGRHECMITRLKHEEDSFTFHYRITPPLPDSGSAALVLPLLEAQDDLGNEYEEYEEYEDRGGAYGTHPDGTCTDAASAGIRPCTGTRAACAFAPPGCGVAWRRHATCP